MTPRLARRGAGGRGRHCAAITEPLRRARGGLNLMRSTPVGPGQQVPHPATITQSEHLSASQQRETAVEIAIISEQSLGPNEGINRVESEHERDT